MNPPLRLEVSQPVLDYEQIETIRHIAKYTHGKFRSCELDITYPLAWGKQAIEARLASLCAQAEDAVRSGYSILDHLRPQDGPRPRGHPGAARPVGGASASGQQGAAHQHRPGRRDRLRARGAPLRAARRLRRRGRASLPRPGHHHRAGRAGPAAQHRCQEGLQELRQGDRQGAAQGHVQDGHLDLHVVYRRADLRGRGAVQGAGRQVLHRHHLDGRGHRRVRDGRGSDPHPPRRVRPTIRCWKARSTRAASTPSGCAARSTCGRRTRSPSCSTRPATTASTPTRNTRRSSTIRASGT